MPHGRRVLAALMTVMLVAAALVTRNGRILVTRRQPGVHLEGHWEFPGGKCDPGEAIEDCLARELREELAVDATVGERLLVSTHDYADRRVELHFFECQVYGEPIAMLGQEVRWVDPRELPSLQFPPADQELLSLLATREGLS
jgi:mutator protein MutT